MADSATTDEAPSASIPPAPKDEKPAILIIGGLGRLQLQAVKLWAMDT